MTSLRCLTILLMVAFAGCATPTELVSVEAQEPLLPEALSAPPVVPDRYLNATLEELDFRASDGTTIHATVYLPTEPRSGYAQQERFGVVVTMHPWFGLYGYDTDDLL